MVYRARVAEARTLLVSARASAPLLRPDLVGRARTLLASGGEVRVADRVLQADDPSIAAALVVVLDDDSLDRAIAACDRLLVHLDTVLERRGPDARTIDAELATVQRTYVESAAGASLGAVILDRVTEWLRSLPLPAISLFAFLGSLELPVLLLAVAIIASLVTILGRGIRERVRPDGLLPGAATAAHGGNPSEQLRRAEVALASGDGREAIHALYQYAIAALTAREGGIRFDPALTDRELLGRAAGVPHVESLRALVALHERVWFGLRTPETGEPARARAWALEVGA